MEIQAGLDCDEVSLLSLQSLVPLVNKEDSLAYGNAEYSKAGNPSRDREGKKAEQLPKEKDAGSHSLVVIPR